MDNREVLLKVEHLEQFFKLGRRKLRAVNDISFEVYKGEVFGIVGESGCGKTTTGRSIIRLYDITGGSVFFHGQRICAGTRYYKQVVSDAKKAYKAEVAAAKADLKAAGESAEAKAEYDRRVDVASQKMSEIVTENIEKIKSASFDHKNCNKIYAQKQIELVQEKYAALIDEETDEVKRQQLMAERDAQIKLAKKDRIMNKMQMIFQDPIASLNPRMTVKEIIAEGLIIRGIKDPEVINQKVFEMLDLVGLVPEHAGRYPHEFSGGQRQRIGIARSVILNPDLIIADEPISALDVSIQAQVINLLNDLRKRLGLTIIFIAHDLSVVKYFSDRIAVMHFGKIVELANSDELFEHPLHPYTKSLLSAIPLPDPHSEKTRKRIVYNPLAEHNYSPTNIPQMREVKEGHFIYCDEVEFEYYKKQIVEMDEAKAEKAEKAKKATLADKVKDTSTTVKKGLKETGDKVADSQSKPTRTKKTDKEKSEE